MSEKKQLEKCCNPNPVSGVVAVYTPSTGDVAMAWAFNPNAGCKYDKVIAFLKPNDEQAENSKLVAITIVDVDTRYVIFNVTEDPTGTVGKFIPKAMVVADCGGCPYADGDEIDIKPDG